LEDNKKAWHSKLKFSLWADRVATKRSINFSPFQLFYGVEVVFPFQLAIPVEKFLQDHQEEPDDMIRRIHQLVEVQQAREQVVTEFRTISRGSSRLLIRRPRRSSSRQET
jgi:hypothetical protein